MQKIVNLIDMIFDMMAQIPHYIIALLARLLVGSIFLKSGLLKFDDWDTAVYLFQEEYVNVPLPPVFGAYLAGYSEVIFGALLMVGLAARFSALALLGMTAVIQIFVYPESYILHGLWVLSYLYVIKYGAGALSADYFVRKAIDGDAR